MIISILRIKCFVLNSFVTGIGTVDISGVSTNVVFLDNGPLQIYSPGVAADPQIRFVYYEKDKIEGGDNKIVKSYIPTLKEYTNSKRSK